MIETWSDFEEFYRYNIFITCVGYDADGEQTYVKGIEKIHREEISKGVDEMPIPVDFKPGEVFTMESDEAKSMLLLIDLVTNTLPHNSNIEETPPFELNVVVRRGGKELNRSKHMVNQWGGANIVVKI